MRMEPLADTIDEMRSEINAKSIFNIVLWSLKFCSEMSTIFTYSKVIKF